MWRAPDRNASAGVERAVLHGATTPMPEPALLERALGSYLGFAVGDALGATVEFMTPGEIAATYGVHARIVGGGWLRLQSGRVTDDTEMSLALGRALVAHRGWNLQAVAEAWADWMRHRPTDIGHTCRRGLRRFAVEGTLSAPPAEEDGGNGALMRHLPLAFATLGDDEAWQQRALEQAHVTHHHPLSDAATVAFGRMTHALLRGGGRDSCRRIADSLVATHPEFRFDPWPGRTSGYVVDTAQTVLDAFLNTTDFESGLLRAVNRGGDADTIGALTGQLAGACYGVQAVPVRWLKRLDPTVQAEIRRQTPSLLALAAAPASASAGVTST